MKIKHLLAASAAAIIAVASANAADIVRSTSYEEVPVVAVPTFSWAGAYAGAQIGGTWGNSKSKSWGTNGELDSKLNTSGFVGGLYAGYNFEVGSNVILGAETDFVWGNVKKNGSTDNGAGYGVTSKVKQKWAGATRLRVGYAADRFMPYLAVGVAYAKLSNAGTYSLAATSFDYDSSKTLTGWTIGAGVDYAVTDNVVLRVEYRYADYGKKSNSYTDATFGNLEQKNSYKTNEIRVGVAYKF